MKKVHDTSKRQRRGEKPYSRSKIKFRQTNEDTRVSDSYYRPYLLRELFINNFLSSLFV